MGSVEILPRYAKMFIRLHDYDSAIMNGGELRITVRHGIELSISQGAKMDKQSWVASVPATLPFPFMYRSLFITNCDTSVFQIS